MSITLTWADYPHQSTQTILQEETSIFSLKIIHREGELPLAQLVVPESMPIPTNQYGYIYCDEKGENHLIFCGIPSKTPISIDPHVKKIELLAIPHNVDKQHEALISPLKTDIHQHFVDPTIPPDPSEYLENTPQLFCYHRVTHEVCLSNLFEGRQTLFLKDQILSNGLSLNLVDSPLSAVQLHITCEWIQEAEGEFNLMPTIETYFPHGMINTLTPTSLLQNWPQRGQLLGRSGYTVTRSHLRLVTPHQTGILGVYPTFTPVISSTSQRYPWHWLQGDLKLSWNYRQKRQEILTITLENTSQQSENIKYSRHIQPPRIIHLPLQQIETRLPAKSASRFLDTPEALPLLQHALDIAHCHLDYSNRAVEMTIQIPFIDGLDLHLDQFVIVEHPCLPGETNRLTGKLTSYVLEKTAYKGIATLKVALKMPEHKENDLKIFAQDLSIISMDSLEGIDDPENLQHNDFIESLIVKNNAKEQIKSLQEGNLNPEQLPPDFATQIYLELKDLRSQSVFVRRLKNERINL